MKEPSKLGSTRDRVLYAAMVLLSSALATAHAQASRVLDDFSDPSRWRVVTSNQVSGSLRKVEGIGGAALCLDYDYNGVSGYEPTSFLGSSNAQMHAVQGIARYVFGLDCPESGSYDDATREAVREIQTRAGITVPLAEPEGWRAFLDAAARA